MINRAHKYHARACEMDGHKFASQAEMRRYQELKLMQAAGAIRNLRLQPRYPLYACAREPAGAVIEFEFVAVTVCEYVADFEYEEQYYQGSWILVTEDVKGMKTPVYNLKAKWFVACYGREIRETR